MSNSTSETIKKRNGKPFDPGPFARAIRARRVSLDWSQGYSASQIGCNRPVYASWEEGRAVASPIYYPQVAHFLAISMEQLAYVLYDDAVFREKVKSKQKRK
jgi:hypothetical protein